MLIELSGVSKIYNQGRANEVRALSDIDLTVEQGSMVCLKGPSGSGKSTLLAIIGCIFPPTSGRAAIAERQLARLPDRFLTLHRRETIGFIFQRFNILPELTVLENITLPLLPLGVGPKERRQRAHALLERFAISHRAHFPAGQISGGELQRVAIARALMVRCRSLTALMAQPTTKRENKSRIAARYSLPLSPITNSVVSPTHRWFGASAVNCRSSRFAATGWS